MGKGEDEWLLHAGLGTLGKADATRIVLESADLDSAEKITFAHPGVTVLVGGNNVGKSTLLRELVDSIRAPWKARTESLRLVNELSIRREGTPEDFIAWALTHAHWSNNGSSLISGGVERLFG